MEVEFFGIAIQVNPSVFQGVAISQNPGSFQGIAVNQNSGAFQGIAVAQSPPVFQGISVIQHPPVFQGIAIQEGVLIPIPNEPGCPGAVIESYLSVVEGEKGQFLCAYDAQLAPLFILRITENMTKTVMETVIGNQDFPGAMRIHGVECKDAFCLNGREASIVVGCEYSNGEIIVRNSRNDDLIRIEGQTGRIAIGGTNTDGDLRVLSPFGSVNSPPLEAALHFSAASGHLHLNGNGLDGGSLWLRRNGVSSIFINGDRGEIEMANADFAEEYEIADARALPGMVMITDPNGALYPCETAYDTRVAGVLSGAGSFQPAIVLDKQKGNGQRRHPVAMIGKTFCYVDASETAIEPGDLLTSSSTPGYAMKAQDPERAFGATLGKAMEALPKGAKGIIPIRVSLI